jgi:hypothetical protein
MLEAEKIAWLICSDRQQAQVYLFRRLSLPMFFGDFLKEILIVARIAWIKDSLFLWCCKQKPSPQSFEVVKNASS